MSPGPQGRVISGTRPDHRYLRCFVAVFDRSAQASLRVCACSYISPGFPALAHYLYIAIISDKLGILIVILSGRLLSGMGTDIGALFPVVCDRAVPIGAAI